MISIHALREEGDPSALPLITELRKFLSTPSARRATVQMLWYALKHPISIHALREEGDLLASAALSTASNFYPRPPRGGRLSASTAARCLPEFLSTPSARRATFSR